VRPRVAGTTGRGPVECRIERMPGVGRRGTSRRPPSRARWLAGWIEWNARTDLSNEFARALWLD